MGHGTPVLSGARFESPADAWALGSGHHIAREPR
jgi:hypothetical protein